MARRNTEGAGDSQLRIDWHRGTRQDWIDKVVIPGLTPRQAKRIIDLLKAVESFARDGKPRWLKWETIAKKMRCSVRTVARAVEDCVSLSLLSYEGCRDPKGASRFEIDWGTLKELIVNNPSTIGLIVRHEGRQSRASTAETTHDTKSGTYDTKVFTHDTKSGTHDTKSPESEGGTTYRASASLNHNLNHEREPEIEPCRADAENEPFVPIAETPTGGWGRPLILRDFLEGATVQRLWEHALKFGYLPDSSYRLRFFTLAKYVGRMAVLQRQGSKGVRDPGAYFTAQLKNMNWLGDSEDERAARNAIAVIDSPRNRGAKSWA